MPSQRGNILFLILLAVVLFAALSYAVTSSMRGGGKGGGEEKAESQAASIIQRAALIENTVMRQMVVASVPDYGFDFLGTNSASNVNGTCSAMPDPSQCRMFSTSTRGGLLSAQIWPEEMFDLSYPMTHPEIFETGRVLNVGTDQDDLMYILRPVTDDICKAINRRMGVNTDLSVTEAYNGSGARTYTGTYTAFPPSVGAIYGNENAAYVGQRTACFRHATNGNHFYHVLIAR